MRHFPFAVILLAAPAFADCADPQTQTEMTRCAGAAFEAADEDLNATYRMAVKVMSQWDGDLPKSERGAEAALRAAQRAWLPYRDATCANEAFFYKGGTMEPLVRASCLERMTRARTEEIRAIAEGE